MKANLMIPFVFILCLWGCSGSSKPGVPGEVFGIFETLSAGDYSWPVSDSVLWSQLRPAPESELPVLGFLAPNDTFPQWMVVGDSAAILAQTNYYVDRQTIFLAVVSLKPLPEIKHADVAGFLADGQNVVIRFNSAGARKWAEMTRKNVGRLIAFVVQGKIYSMPKINEEIKSGMAVISGLPTEEKALELADFLNRQ